MDNGINRDGSLKPQATQTQYRGSNYDEYRIYVACADDGHGGDITRGGAPLKTYEEWLGA